MSSVSLSEAQFVGTESAGGYCIERSDLLAVCPVGD